ncbi:MAG: hypothetical protein ACI9R3_003973 [Verrucomicrobiales bacterium]|jgi:hypothetical protein
MGQYSLPFSQVLAAQNLIHRAELADFNGDGTLDIFAMEGDSVPDQPLIWLSQIEPEPSHWEPLELPPVLGTFTVGTVTTGDIDRDGAVDLIVPDNSNGLAIWFAEGQSYEPVTYPVLRNVAFVDVGDLDLF